MIKVFKDSSLNKLFFKKYKVLSKITETSHCNLYFGKNIKTDENVAIKILKETKENAKNIQETKKFEQEAYNLYRVRGYGIPNLISFGKSGKMTLIVQTLLGESINDIFIKKNKKFNLKDICMIGLQLIDRLEHIHSKFFIHRDIKPQNFLMGEKDKSTIYLIDFGISQRYMSSRTGKHVTHDNIGIAFGTPKYASVNALRGFQQSRKDDFLSLIYVLIYFFNGYLPWEIENKKAKTVKELYAKNIEMKIKFNVDEFCKNNPISIRDFYKYVNRLKFEEKPDYNFLRKLINIILNFYNINNDLRFSWLGINDFALIHLRKHSNLSKRRTSPQSRLYVNIKKLLDKSVIRDKSLDINSKTTLESQDKLGKLNYRNLSISQNDKKLKDYNNLASFEEKINIVNKKEFFINNKVSIEAEPNDLLTNLVKNKKKLEFRDKLSISIEKSNLLQNFLGETNTDKNIPGFHIPNNGKITYKRKIIKLNTSPCKEFIEIGKNNNCTE